MSRNASERFNIAPTVNVRRSTWTASPQRTFTGNVSRLIPFYWQEVLAGDTVKMNTAKVFRLQTPLTPFMDNLYLDTYYFFVPNRLLWTHWKNFMGESDRAWMPTVEYTVPQVKFNAGTGPSKGSPADYLGVPFNVSQNGSSEVNALPFRAYDLIYNEWFRDENLIDPVNLAVNDSNVTYTDSGTGSTKKNCYKVAKLHDYFTSCLPSPQRGPDVELPLGDAARVYTSLSDNPFSNYPRDASGGAIALHMRAASSGSSNFTGTLGVNQGNVADYGGVPSGSSIAIYPSNLYADLTTATGSSINQLRMAFAVQKFYERSARSGSRYREVLRAHFGVTSPDARMQIPEYLGGNRLPLSCMQIVSQNGDTTDGKLGRTGAMSLTTDVHSDFEKSFTEHGILMGVCCVRYRHTYQQGIDNQFLRKTKFDYFWPELDNIGEQPVLKKEIFANGSAADNDVFGYQEAWAGYRYFPDRVMAEMRSDYSMPLDSWHFADDYNSHPSLSGSWIEEDQTNVDRCLSVSSSVADQFFCQFAMNMSLTRPMALYSIPGFIDHN